MAGIYIHIPFCKSRCVYCGFYSTTRSALRQRYVDAVCREMELRRDYLPDDGWPIETIYLGGGTPSQLTIGQLRQLLLYINKVYGDRMAPSSATEVTLECNPDDVTPAFAASLPELGINRVSMGVQTFSDERLRFLRRRHSARQVTDAVKSLRAVGIGNISIDLMYGFPRQTQEEWLDDISAATALGVEHLSAYSLMYEEGTVLYEQLRNGTIEACGEEAERLMYETLIKRLEAAGYEHYEISNFARPGFRSRHNSSYWAQTPYLGLGAAAHSYDRRSRQWNVADLSRYMAGIASGHPDCGREELAGDTWYNDLVTTAMRTREGISLPALPLPYREHLLSAARRYLADGLLAESDGRLHLTRRGLFVSDMVMSDLMKV